MGNPGVSEGLLELSPELVGKHAVQQGLKVRFHGRFLSAATALKRKDDDAGSSKRDLDRRQAVDSFAQGV